MMSMNIIYNRIITAYNYVNKKHGIKIAYIAKYTGRSKSYITRIVKNKLVNVNISKPTIKLISQAMRVRFDWIMTGEGEMMDTAPMILDKVAEDLEPYNADFTAQIERVKYIYKHGSDIQKDQLYVCIGRVYDGIEKEKIGG